MYTYQHTPMGNPYISPLSWVFMGSYDPQESLESLENTINTMGTLLRVHQIVHWTYSDCIYYASAIITGSLQTQWPTSIVSLLIGLNIFTPYFSNSPIASHKLKENKSENVILGIETKRSTKSCYGLLCAPHVLLPSHPFLSPTPSTKHQQNNRLDTSICGWLLCPITPNLPAIFKAQATSTEEES